ncbi:MAG: MBL fold metallo-hydrolase [Gammaproteobacteria bacterium]|nr:MBL fold metallo-hydrolase [Gammaproteobacteria bacterium]
MLFRQLFDPVSSTYTYLLADRQGGEALIIDPVLDRADQYLQLIRELDLKLVLAADTHIHADHVTAIGKLRATADCATALGEQSGAECVSLRIREGEILKAGNVFVEAIYTPGHTDDSYSFVMDDRVFTGDTLLIRGTGRTDFQNGDAGAQYDSLFNRLLKLPEETLVYPAHDYEGRTCSSIGEEKRHNPRLQVSSRQEYIERMNALRLEPPRMIDVAVPANRRCGLGV